MVETSKRLWDLMGVEDTKKKTKQNKLSRHNRMDVHMNLQETCHHTQGLERTKTDGVTVLCVEVNIQRHSNPEATAN